MKLVIILLRLTSFLILLDCVFSVVMIPHIETKSWIRRQRRQSCRGPDCLAQQEEKDQRNCGMERNERLRLAQLTQSNEYIPECRKDGTYGPIQCHPGTKACWCVTLTGKPIVGSTVFNKNPNCSKYRKELKPIMARRSSSQGRKPRRACSHRDRAKFNAALIKAFRSEFIRVRTLTSLYKELDPNSDKIVLTWKFDHLDKDKNGFLYRNETDNLKRLVKTQIQPRPCANSFIPLCSKGDKKISKLEWLDCLQYQEVEIQNLPFATFNSLVDSGSRGMHPFQQLRPVPGSTALTTSLRNSNPAVAEPSNCWADRQSALTSQQLDSNKSIIIPECTPDGKYQKTQCAHGRSYCWCTNETTGLEIPDTVTINSVPNCEKLMTGCLGKKKDKFIEDLLDTFSKVMNQGDKRRFLGNQRNNLTLEEQAAKWNFHRLDDNQNGFLDRKEWKVFKSETAADPKLKNCGKKFPRHCDVNKDKKVSASEWTNCLQLKRTGHSSRRTSQRSSGGPRVGKNPFTTILQR